MNVQNFRKIKILVLGFSLGSFEEKGHLDVVHVERHKIYYREGSGASSQRLRAM
jgi:hypothetical protein